jgi:hypothetical protein
LFATTIGNHRGESDVGPGWLGPRDIYDRVLVISEALTGSSQHVLDEVSRGAESNFCSVIGTHVYID